MISVNLTRRYVCHSCGKMKPAVSRQFIPWDAFSKIEASVCLPCIRKIRKLEYKECKEVTFKEYVNQSIFKIIERDYNSLRKIITTKLPKKIQKK
jgi:hypothetical protein